MIPCSFQAKLHIYFNNPADPGREIDATVQEVSETNVRLSCPPLAPDELKLLLQEWRFAKLWLPGQSRAQGATGKIVWVSQRDSPEARLGMSLDAGSGDAPAPGVQALIDAARAHPAPHEDEEAAESSWGSVMAAMARLFVCPEPKKRPAPPAAAASSAIPAPAPKVSCHFGVEFELEGNALANREPLRLEVVNVSGAGLRAKARGRGLKAITQALRDRTLSRIQLCRSGRGWLTLERTNMRFAAPARVVWLGEKYRDRDGSVVDLALAIEGEADESRHAQSALIDMANSNPRPATGS